MQWQINNKMTRKFVKVVTLCFENNNLIKALPFKKTVTFQYTLLLEKKIMSFVNHDKLFSFMLLIFAY